LFGSQCFGIEAWNPRQGSAVGEAEVIAEGDDKAFEVGGVLKESSTIFGLMAEVVGNVRRKVAE
jgi:hypothetical protein